MKNMRHRCREFVTQSLYQWLLCGGSVEDIDLQMQLEPGFNKIDQAHFKALLYGITRDVKTLEQQLEPCLDRRAQELSPIERAILLIGSFELINHIEIPYRVVINEAVELAKTFGSVEGYKYVNGVLDKLAARLRQTELPRARRSA